MQQIFKMKYLVPRLTNFIRGGGSLYKNFRQLQSKLSSDVIDVQIFVILKRQDIIIFLLIGLRIYTGEYKAQGSTLCPTEGRALRGPRVLDSPV